MASFFRFRSLLYSGLRVTGKFKLGGHGRVYLCCAGSVELMLRSSVCITGGILVINLLLIGFSRVVLRRRKAVGQFVGAMAGGPVFRLSLRANGFCCCP